ncbi:MAG: hypothetical protein JSV44_00430 [Candidatus Zixiibacteriota bacterium]|nr:MAG: hypothetical protein JSV44_00430 [candidate division Zixibacteria bacterium]
MPIKAIKVMLKAPASRVPRGRGFYQLEEEALYVPVEYPGQKSRFFSYLDSDTVSFQLDRDGRLIFIEITLPRRRWKVKPHLVPPEIAEAADVRFPDFRERFPNPSVFCDEIRQLLLIRFGRGPSAHNYYLAENLIAQTTEENRLVAIWVSDITNDLAGRKIARWRRRVHEKRIGLKVIAGAGSGEM